MKQSEIIFEHDAVGRLRMINFLHDFENAKSNINLVEAEFFQYANQGISFAQGNNSLDIDDIVHNAFFPQIKMQFSHKENPLSIVKAMDKQYAILREEMLLFQQKID